MKDYDNHTHRAGLPVTITAPGLTDLELLQRADTLQDCAEHMGTWVDFNPEIGISPAGLETAISMEYEATKRPGLNLDKSYRYARNEAHATRVLLAKIEDIKAIAGKLGLVINQAGPVYIEQL